MSAVRFILNGEPCEAPGEMRLIDFLRDWRGLTAAKIGCDIGRCGACMVWVDQAPANACLVPVWRLEDRRVTSPEGLDGDPLTECVRRALAEENAFQCGYCAPGFVMTLTAALREDPGLDEAALRAALAGNICRCTGYHSILRGALRAASDMKEASP
jgi:carbon-monoxide dehydrogenase small subunit